MILCCGLDIGIFPFLDQMLMSECSQSFSLWSWGSMQLDIWHMRVTLLPKRKLDLAVSPGPVYSGSGARLDQAFLGFPELILLFGDNWVLLVSGLVTLSCQCYLVVAFNGISPGAGERWRRPGRSVLYQGFTSLGIPNHSRGNEGTTVAERAGTVSNVPGVHATAAKWTR